MNAIPRNCERCGTDIDEGAQFCPGCGAAAPVPDGPDDEGQEVNSILFAANLSRMRHQWEDALEKCEQVLEQEPDNASAHGLLGDIYYSQGRMEDAVIWYEMAADLEPENASFGAKLERARRAAETARRARAAAASPTGGGQLDRFVRGEGFRTLIQITTLVLAGLALIVIAAALVAKFTDKPADFVEPSQYPTTTGPSTPAAPRWDQRQAPAPPPTQSASPSQATPTAATGSSEGGQTPPEQAFLARVQQSGEIRAANINVRYSLADPRNESVTIIFQTIANGPQDQQRVLQQALVVARAAFAEEYRATSVTVRANATLTSHTGNRTMQPAFVGNISPQQASQDVGESPSLTVLQGLFTSVFWHPVLRGGFTPQPG